MTRIGRWWQRLKWRVIPHSWLVRADAWREACLDIAPALISSAPSHRLRLAGYRRLGAKIGAHTSIHRGCRFYATHQLAIGSHTVVNPQVILDARRGLRIGDNVSISEQVALYTLQHDLDAADFCLEGAPIVIEDYVFIGARAIILPGVRLGRGAAVAAGAVVTRDVPEYTIVAGVPAAPLRERARDLRYNLDYRRTFY